MGIADEEAKKAQKFINELKLKNNLITTEQAFQRLNYAFKNLSKEMSTAAEAMDKLGFVISSMPKKQSFWKKLWNKIKSWL
jgi:hypothetical protein